MTQSSDEILMAEEENLEGFKKKYNLISVSNLPLPDFSFVNEALEKIKE
jgi:hypothetical protein